MIEKMSFVSPLRWHQYFGLLVLLWATAIPAETTRYAFGVNGMDFSLSRYRVMPTGELRNLGHTPLVKSVPFVLLDPSGRFVLVPSKTVSHISVFRLNAANGELVEVPGSPFKAKANSPFELVFHPSGKFLYAAARFSGVAAYAFDAETGALKPLEGSPFRAQRRTRGVTIHPSGQFLYASNGYSNSVSGYRVDEETGVLIELLESPFSAGETRVIDYKLFGMEDVPEGAGGIPYDVAMDPKGRFVFVANWAAATVSAFRIDAKSGGLTAVKGSPFFTGFNPYRLEVHPTGRFLYVAQFSGSEIAVHSIDEKTGGLSLAPDSTFATGGLGPVAVNFNATGSQLYVPNYESNDISLFDVDATTGALVLREIVKTRSGPWYLALAKGDVIVEKNKPEAIVALGSEGLARLDLLSGKLSHITTGEKADAVVVSPDGNFAYSLNRKKQRLTTFVIDPKTGDMTLVKNGVVATGRLPNNPTIDVNGWYLYVSNAGDNNLRAYYLNPKTGVPQMAQKKRPTATEKTPVSMALDAAARYALVTNVDSNTVSVYRYMNSVTPLIFKSSAKTPSFATGKKPVAVVVDPTGRFAYVANAGSKNISAYRIHHQTGALTELPGSPFITRQRPQAVIAHPNGKWLYLVNAASRDLSLFEIETELGALSPQRVAVRLSVKIKSLWLNTMGDVVYALSLDGRRLLQYQVNEKSGKLKLLTDKRIAKAISDLFIVE